jgi:NHLM bacteriocin system ABC transporter ATP-binding protein
LEKQNATRRWSPANKLTAGAEQMSFNVFEEQLNQRRLKDQEMFETAFADLASILGVRTGGKPPAEKEAAARGALEEILAYYEVPLPEVPESVFEIEAQFEYVLRASGLIRRRVELIGSWWKDAQGIFLASTGDGEIIVLKPGSYGGYFYNHPKTGLPVKINKGEAKNIERDAFSFNRPLPAKKLSLRDLGLYLLQSIDRVDIIYVLVISLLISLLGLFMPYINKQIFDSVIPSGVKGNIIPVSLLLLGAAIGSTLFTIARGLLLGRFEDKTKSVQIAAMMRIFNLPATFFKDYTAGELSSRYSSLSGLISMITNTVLTSGLTALFSFVYIFQMAGFAPMLVLPGLTIIFIMLLFSLLTTIIQLNVSRKIMQLSAKLSGLVFALFSGVQKIKLAGAEKRAFAKWAAAYKEVGKLSYAPPLFLRINGAISVLLTFGGMLILYFFAGTSGIAPANYIAFTIAYGAVSSSVLALGGVAVTAANIKPMLEMVQPILEAVPENSDNKKILTSLSGGFELNNITFRYDPEGPLILDDLSLKVRPGEYLGIVGKTGCGKSTLVRILLGFEQPETGAVYYDGHDLTGIDLQSVRRMIGVCLQNGKLFSGDIFSNIIITAPWKNLDDAWEAARLAGIEEDIKAMPMNMHTMISEGSGGVSGGQRQRLLIARALVSKPKLVFFDEATSALDNITQKIVAESLNTLKCTRVIIAHRLSTIRSCDRIIVLDEGRIVEEGNYDKLIANEGYFYELTKRQII